MSEQVTLSNTNTKLAEAFGIEMPSKLFSRLNIAPTQDILVVRESAETGQQEAVSMRWGLIPPWEPDEFMPPLHHRMPVLLQPKDYGQ